MKKYIIFITSLLSASLSHAALNYTCADNNKNFSFKNNDLQLTCKTPSSPQRFYLLTNISNQTFWLDMAVHPDTASAGWGSQIHPGHYSIVAMDKPNFTFSCTYLDKNNHVSPLNCQQVLSVCQLGATPRRDGKPAPYGSYWVFEDLK